MKNKIIVLLLLLVGVQFGSFAQKTTFQVVTKTIEETSNWQAKQTLEINGENAIIHISTWDKDKIHTTVELIAKHPEKKIAEQDLEVLQYSITSQRKRIILNNYLSINSKSPKPTSTLKTKFTLRIPANCPLAIKNNFGSIYIEGMRQQLEIDSRFTKITIEDIKGEIHLNSHLGEITGSAIVGNTTITSNRSNVYLEKVAGKVIMDATYGQIEIVESASYKYDLEVKGNKSDIMILNTDTALNNYALSTSFGKISTPPNTAFDVLVDSDSLKTIKTVLPTPKSNITISLYYGDIDLQSNP